MVRLTDLGQLEEHFMRISVCTFKCNFNVKLSEKRQKQCLTEWEHQTTRRCYWSHRVSQQSTGAWPRASLPCAWVTTNGHCLLQCCHIPDGSIYTHCLRARDNLIYSRKPWARVFRTRLCHVIAHINHG